MASKNTNEWAAAQARDAQIEQNIPPDLNFPILDVYDIEAYRRRLGKYSVGYADGAEPNLDVLKAFYESVATVGLEPIYDGKDLLPPEPSPGQSFEESESGATIVMRPRDAQILRGLGYKVGLLEPRVNLDPEREAYPPA